METDLVHGDILDQPVEAIVNPWNRNVIPWWLLIPQGVSGAIKRRGGIAPFQALARCGPIPLGEARLTRAGRLPFNAIIHVAGINLCWLATELSVRNSVIHAMELAKQHDIKSLAFPIIGSGSGNRGESWALHIMQKTFATLEHPIDVKIVVYSKPK